jgi:hypothetical protein
MLIHEALLFLIIEQLHLFTFNFIRKIETFIINFEYELPQIEIISSYLMAFLIPIKWTKFSIY